MGRAAEPKAVFVETLLLFLEESISPLASMLMAAVMAALVAAFKVVLFRRVTRWEGL